MFNNICMVQKCVRIYCCQIREKEMGGREKSKGATLIDRSLINNGIIKPCYIDNHS